MATSSSPSDRHHRRRAKHAQCPSDPGPLQALTVAAMTPALPVVAGYLRDIDIGIGRADDGCAPGTGWPPPSDEAEKNALWDEAYDAMRSNNKSLVKKFEAVVMGKFSKMAKDQSPRDALLRGLVAFPKDTETRRRLMREITRMQLTLDAPAQTAHHAVKAATNLLEMLQKQLSPVLQLYPPAGLAFGGLCLVLRMVDSTMTLKEEMMEGLSHIADAVDWYLQLCVSSVLHCKGSKKGDGSTSLHNMLVNLFSIMLEYQVRSVMSSQSFYKTIWPFRLNEFSDLLSRLKEKESYFDRKIGLSAQTQVYQEQEQAVITSVIRQFSSPEEKRVTSEEDKGIAEVFAEWLHGQPGFKNWENGSRGILVVNSTRRTNPALAGALALTLRHGRDEILTAHFASTDTRSKSQFSKMAMALTHQLLLQRQDIALGPVAEVRNHKGVEGKEELLIQSVAHVLKGLGRNARVIFVLDLSRTLLAKDREGFQQLISKIFCTDETNPQPIKLLITSHMDVCLNKFLSTFGDMTTYLRVPPDDSVTKATSSTDATSSAGVTSSKPEPLFGCSTERSITDTNVLRTARGIDFQLVPSVLLMMAGACRPLTLAELASSVAAYCAVTEGSNVMEVIGGEELRSLLVRADCLKYVKVSLRVDFISKTAENEAAKVYGLGGVMPKRHAKLALAEASIFFLSQQVAGLTLDEVDELAKGVALDLDNVARTSGSTKHCAAVENSIINASFTCYAAEHSAPQLVEFPIHDAQNGSLRLRPSLQKSQQQLWQPHHFCMRFWYHRVNALDVPIHDSHIAYLSYSRASGPISRDFGENLFIAAVELGHLDFVTEGLRRGQNANETNQFGHNALHIAAMHEDVAMSRILLDKVGVDMLAEDTLGFTPIHLAADLGNPELLEVFFKAAQRRLNPSQILKFRSMFDNGPESRRHASQCKCGYDQLIERFVLSRGQTSLNRWESRSLATCSLTPSGREIGKAMVYIACRRHPGLMQTFLELGINEAKLQER